MPFNGDKWELIQFRFKSRTGHLLNHESHVGGLKRFIDHTH